MRLRDYGAIAPRRSRSTTSSDAESSIAFLPGPFGKIPHRIDVSEVAADAGPDQSFVKLMAIQVFYEGNVQGVGFRYSVLLIARGFDVTGFVRNLRDGRVEMQASGEDDEVSAFIEAIGQSQLRSHIKKQSETPLANPPPFRGFEIRYD